MPIWVIHLKIFILINRIYNFFFFFKLCADTVRIGLICISLMKNKSPLQTFIRSWLYSSEYSQSDAFKTPVSLMSDTKILGLAPLHQSGKILNTFCQPSHHSVKNNPVKRQNRIPIESSR